MNNPLLATKLFAPPTPPTLVARPRLVDHLNDGLRQGRRLSLVSAPAGYGKTTLVVEWLTGQPVAWLSLDEHDNDPVRFFTYLVEALHRLHPNVGATANALLDASPPPALPEVVVALINDLAALDGATGEPFRLALVLDDYHVLRQPAIHDALSFLLSRQPPTLHLVVVSREDPPLPLARLRVRNQLTEVRAADLRFTEVEAAQFFRHHGVDLQDQAVAALDRRTEGWIAGLQLAALSLHSRADVDAFIAAFSGTHRYVIDYLVEEVLGQQASDIRAFLNATAVLDRLCAPLCDALTERDDSRAVLDHLEHVNLFLVPLDDERRWYRYHHLFADSLRAGLPTDYCADLHRRAAAWFEGQGLLADAVKHALAAEDFKHAGDLIDQTARTTISPSGNLPMLAQWSDLLPEDVLRAHPQLSLYYARSLFFKGRPRAAQRYLDVAAATIQGWPPDEAATREARGLLLVNHSTFAAMRGAVGVALDTARAAQELVAHDDRATRARLMHAVGFAHLLRGDAVEAQRAFAEAVALAQAVGNTILGLDVVGYLARATLAQGDVAEARRVCEQALAGGDPPAACAVYLALAGALEAQGDMAGASEALERSVALGEQAGWAHILWEALARLALARQTQGDASAAEAALRRAEQLARDYDIAYVRDRVAAYRARLHLMRGELAPALRWADAYRRAEQGEIRRAFEDETLALVRMAEAGRPLPPPEQAHTADTLIEPLSERELEILRLLAAGRSNQEIADHLVITVGTAKWHVHHIYGKLGVRNRAEALLRAQALGLR